MRVLFDEAHSEAWTIRPELAARMQPAHPGDASYAMAAAALRARGAEVTPWREGMLDAAALHGVDVVVIAHPSAPEWERTTGAGSPRFSADELATLQRFVHGGGGLVVLGETEERKYGANLDELLDPFGIALASDTVQDYERHAGAPSWIIADLADGGRGASGDLLAGVRDACFYRATTIARHDGARVLARAGVTSSAPGAPLAVAGEPGDGRIVVLADSDLFGDDCLGAFSHRRLWLNLVFWAAGGQLAPRPARVVRMGQTALSGPAAEPAWGELRDACHALADLEDARGALRDPETDGASAREHARAVVDAIVALAPHFPHQAGYLRAVAQDVEDWVASGFGRPDFGRSLRAFRPELDRRDGAEHLAVFPMYKQNGSPEICFEALIVRVPWPEAVAALERERYPNSAFVPVELVAHTRGYDSECAVLFPEMVAAAGAVPNHFGAIFCDREAARLRRVAGAAAELLALNLPPDGAWLLSDPVTSRDAYVLWDLIHDRTHSHGELPFDPFMVRQRAPYWMYALEELRCDLTAFGEAVALEAEGEPSARDVQYAILLDRMLRFPICGTRVRNYDGLGGQLLFAHLHREGHLSWSDNRLTVDWDTVTDGVASLRAEIEALYRAGIDRSKLAHWAAAHDLIASRVPPAAGSRWAGAVRELTEVEDPRIYLDLVLPDEFPLSIFLSSLRSRLASAPS